MSSPDAHAPAPARWAGDQQQESFRQDLQVIHSSTSAHATPIATRSDPFDTAFLDLSNMAEGVAKYRNIYDFKACHTVLHLPELCTTILDHMNMWELRECMEIGGHIAEVIKGTPHLAKQIFLEFDSEMWGFHNIAIFWDSSACTKFPACTEQHRHEADFMGMKMGNLKMELDHHFEESGGLVELYVQGYDNIVAALQSNDLHLQEYLGNRSIDLKLVVQNDSYLDFQDGDWQGPPSPISWKAAELTIRLPRLGVILSIAKKLYECAEEMDKKLFSGELGWNEEAGTVDGLVWKPFFSSTELDVVLCDQPQFRWFNGGGPQSYLCGGTSFAEHQRLHAAYWATVWPLWTPT